MKWWGWVLSLLPAGLGILLSILASNEIISNPVFFLRGSLAAIAIRGGIALSILIIAAVLVWNRRQKQHRQRQLVGYSGLLVLY